MKKWIVLTSMLFCLQPAIAKTDLQSVPLKVTENGFEPGEINVKPGTHVVLKVTRTTDATCATQIKFSEKKIKKELPLNKEVSIDLGVVEKGEIRFACGMDMITGHLIVK